MGLTFILVGFIIILSLVNLLMVEWPSLRAVFILRKMHGPPVWPIIGGVFIIMTASPTDLMNIIKKYADQYKRLVYFPAGGILNVFVKEPEDLQIILSSTIQIQKGFEYKLIEPWLKEGLLTSTGAKWHARRKLLTPTFHFRILEDTISGMNKSTSLLIENLEKAVEETITISDYITKCTLDIIGETAMGIQFEAQTKPGNNYVQRVKSVSESVIKRILSVWQFNEFLFKLSQNGRSYYKNLKELHDFTRRVIKDRKQSFNESIFLSDKMEDDVGRKSRKAFLDCLLETQRIYPELTDDDIGEEVETFMFEGHDTTSAAISFTLWILGSNPVEQEMVAEELIEIFGYEDRNVTMEDTHRMVYLEKVIKETLRLYPSVPYISRRLIQDCELEDGTILPATTNVVMMPYFIHRNPRYFPDPEKFDPERFSPENSIGRHPFVYIPFSAGPRNCIGQKFAMLEMKVTLSNILRKLRVTAVTREDEFKVLPHLISRPTAPLKVRFTPRNAKSS